MSTSSVRTNSGAVALDSAIRRAIVCWSRVSSSIVVSPRPVVASPDLAAGFAASASGAGSVGRASSCSAGASSAGAPFFAAAWTSDFTIRPPGPVPVSPDSSTPSSAAIRRAIGDAFTRPLPSPAGWSTCSSAVATGASSSDCSDSGALSSAVGTSERSGGGASSAGSSSGAASSAAGSCSPPASSAGFDGAAADRRDRLADRERVALLGHDLERAGLVGLVGHVGLVGLDLDQLVAAGDLVPVGLEPLQDRALLHRVGQAGHRDIGHARSV